MRVGWPAGGEHLGGAVRGQEGTFRGGHVGALRALESRFLGMFRWLGETLECMRGRVGALEGWLVGWYDVGLEGTLEKGKAGW